MEATYLDPISDSFCEVVRNLLNQGINSHFPNINPELESDEQFFVHLKDWQ